MKLTPEELTLLTSILANTKLKKPSNIKLLESLKSKAKQEYARHHRVDEAVIASLTPADRYAQTSVFIHAGMARGGNTSQLRQREPKKIKHPPREGDIGFDASKKAKITSADNLLSALGLVK